MAHYPFTQLYRLNHKNRKVYTKEYKASILRRLEPPTDDTVASLSEELYNLALEVAK